MKKYKILECLEKLSVKEHKIVIKAIPKIIGRSKNTFWNYCMIDIRSKMDIPYTVVAKLEKLFGVAPGGLLNVPVKSVTYQRIVEEHEARNSRLKLD